MASYGGNAGATGSLSKFNTATALQANGGSGGQGEQRHVACCIVTFSKGANGSNGTATGPSGATLTTGGGAAGGVGASRFETACNCQQVNTQVGGNGGNGGKVAITFTKGSGSAPAVGAVIAVTVGAGGAGGMDPTCSNYSGANQGAAGGNGSVLISTS